jgi:hypothetical protein
LSLPDFAEFIHILNDHGVRYLVIGGYAVAFHGHPRATDDVDVLIAPDEQNVRRVERALVEFVGIAPRPESLRSPRGMVRIGGPITHIDITTKVDGLATFDPLWMRREHAGREAASLGHDALVDARGSAARAGCARRQPVAGEEQARAIDRADRRR